MTPTTVIGTLIDATGAPENAVIAFKSLSTPQAANPLVQCNTTAETTTNPNNGNFSQLLEAGNYLVTVTPQDQSQIPTNFNIAVPDNGGSVEISTLITSSFPTLPSVAPFTVWNNVFTGNITVQPMNNPPQFTTQAVNNVSGHQNGSSAFNYRIAWQNATGTTMPNPLDVPNTPPTGGNNATRILLPTAPATATAVLIYRSNDGTGNRYLLASVAPSSTFYDDWESQSDFNTTGVAMMPTYNSTAGGMVMLSGNILCYFTDKGIMFPNTNFRIAVGKGAQIFDTTTGLWHTLQVTGSPPNIGTDSGNAP